jgi:hypothetical protein
MLDGKPEKQGGPMNPKDLKIIGTSTALVNWPIGVLWYLYYIKLLISKLSNLWAIENAAAHTRISGRRGACADSSQWL